MDKKRLRRLAAVLHDVSQPGTCEAAVAILKGMSDSEQQMAGVEFPRELVALATSFSRILREVPRAAEAAQDTIDLGLA